LNSVGERREREREREDKISGLLPRVLTELGLPD